MKSWTDTYRLHESTQSSCAIWIRGKFRRTEYLSSPPNTDQQRLDHLHRHGRVQSPYVRPREELRSRARRLRSRPRRSRR